jgi:Ca2+-binding RTX toxin-like protein
VNSLVLHGIAPSELTVVRNGNDAIVLIGSNGADGRITIRGQFNGSGSMSSIRFDDNTVWTAQTVLALAVANDGSVLTHAGTGGMDTITGSSDIDVIDGGAGNDTLRGEGGSDFYRWGAGSGNDAILENGSGSDADTVRLMGINPAEVSLGRLGSDLYITLTATGEVLKVQGHFNSTAAGIEQISSRTTPFGTARRSRRPHGSSAPARAKPSTAVPQAIPSTVGAATIPSSVTAATTLIFTASGRVTTPSSRASAASDGNWR